MMATRAVTVDHGAVTDGKNPIHPAVWARLMTLPTVDLDELVNRAALQTRVDRKYVIRMPILAALLDRIGADVSVLDIENTRIFRYSSMYFDTPDLICFRDHRQGKRRRFKVRTRHYVDSGQCMFEVKAPDARGATVKHRMDHSLSDSHVMTPGAADFTGDILAGNPAVPNLRPTLTTDYDRITLLDNAAGGRITVDLGLRFTVAPGSYGASMDPAFASPADTMIVETKSEHGLGIADRALREMRIRPSSMSKYCTGIALTHPHLAANRWHRVLRQHFGLQHNRASAL